MEYTLKSGVNSGLLATSSQYKEQYMAGMDFEAYSLYCDEVLEPVLRNYSGKYAGVLLGFNEF